MSKRIVFFALFALLIISCAETKYVPDGEYLLDKVELQSDQPARYISVSDMRSYIRQRGNSRWFSTTKLPLKTYSLSGRDSSKWVNRMLRAMGEPPVIYDSALTMQSMQSLLSQMQNLGYLRSSVDVSEARS